MSTETPRTDAETRECREFYDQGGHGIAQTFKAADGECVPADFARMLERENSEMRGALTEIAGYDAHSKHGEGICPYGCDCPNIARAALARASK